MQGSFETGSRWAQWDESLRPTFHFRSFATREAGLRQSGSFKWPPSWNSSPVSKTDSFASGGPKERAKSAPPARCRDEKRQEQKPQMPRWDSSLETSIRERAGKSQLKVTLPKYAEPFRPKSAPRPARPEVDRSRTAVSRSWDGSPALGTAIGGRPKAAGNRSTVAGTDAYVRQSASARVSSDGQNRARTSEEWFSTTKNPQGNASQFSERNGKETLKPLISGRPFVSGHVRMRESVSKTQSLDFDYGQGTKRLGNTIGRSRPREERDNKVVSKSRVAMSLDVDAAADAAFAKALSLLRQSAPAPVILKPAAKTGPPAIQPFSEPGRSVFREDPLSKTSRLAHALPRMSLSRKMCSVGDPRVKASTVSQTTTCSHDVNGRKAATNPHRKPPRKAAGLVKGVVAATGEGAAECFGLSRASEGLRVWKSARAAGSSVCLVELGRRETTGLFVKLVMTDREGSPGGVRFAHAAELTDALEEVGYGEIRFHANEHPCQNAPVVRTFKLGPQTVIGRYLSVTLYPRGGLSDSLDEITVQRIYVGRGDPNLLSEDVLMMRPEKRPQLLGSLRHVFIEVAEGEEKVSNRIVESGDVLGTVSKESIRGLDNPGEVKESVKDREASGNLGGAETLRETPMAFTTESGYRAISTQSSMEDLGYRFSISEYADGAHLTASGGRCQPRLERITSPGPDHIGEWLSREDRPSLEEGMPAYVPKGTEGATFNCSSTQDGRLSSNWEASSEAQRLAEGATDEGAGSGDCRRNGHGGEGAPCEDGNGGVAANGAEEAGGGRPDHEGWGASPASNSSPEV